MSQGSIHSSAIVHPDARIGMGCRIGPFSVVGAGVTLGPECELISHAVVDGRVEVGEGCRFFPFCSIGLEPQDLKYRGEPTRVVIGRRNTFREFVTVHSGTQGGGAVTTIGDRNLFMAYTHVAHDCRVGSDTIFANAATLAGHVTVEDFAVIGAFSGVHQFCRVGAHAYIGGYSVITQDALPYVLTVGNRAKAYGMNLVGLKRRAFSEESIAALRQAYRLLFQSNLTTTRALERIDADLGGIPEVAYLASFIRSSERGIVK
ncbi:MAG TPA: acyl-ACP--UDP-N-acetylglucosamine O-acyltransferase [Candidatus Polarisedimenticolia bacterium]|jgi:UDP-N-acetylglucosamine acyltransferase|nr:acyl-ACP--UDP-N-acetylglucosamine O-acyltransferase [Candidatus Polarisedimenticolia bacterium]